MLRAAVTKFEKPCIHELRPYYRMTADSKKNVKVEKYEYLHAESKKINILTYVLFEISNRRNTRQSHIFEVMQQEHDKAR